MNKKRKTYVTYKEMIDDQKEFKEGTLKDINKSSKKMSQSKRKKTFIIVLILSLILIKSFIKKTTITITNNNLFSLYNNRLYSVTVNKVPVTTYIEETKTLTMVPYVFDLSIWNTHAYYEKNQTNKMLEFSLGDSIAIDVSAYKCYYERNKKNYETTCAKTNQKLIENLIKKPVNNINYNLFIKETKKGEKVLYDGELTSDIGNYFQSKGRHLIRITGTYSNVKSHIDFWITIV